MPTSSFKNCKMQLSLMGNQDTPRETDKPHIGRYAVIPLQSFLGNTTPDK